MRFAHALCLAAVATGLAACAAKPPVTDAEAVQEYNDNNDPLEPLNRVSYAISDGADTYILAPVARAYRFAVPGVVRRPIHNFLHNLTTPVILINDVIQTRPRRAGDTFMRFVINTTAGAGGLFDVATGLGYPVHSNDFGMTLALWSVPSGPYLFLPLLGPSNPRDSVGYGVDVAFDPLTYVPHGYGFWTGNDVRAGVAIVDSRERVLDEVASIKKTALDPYATFRSLARQNRESEIDRAKSDDRTTPPNWFSH